MLVRDILDFGPGTVIELDKLAGDPVDVLVNGKIVAQGEVVVADDHFGVRITILLSPQDRVRSLA
jgi:flagellar motor switch protein FliN/FliY